MERFLARCADYIYKKHASELKDICLVFPNRRSGVFFTAYLQEKIEGAVIGPKTTTVNELIAAYSDWHTGDKLELISLLYDVFSKHTKTHETFDEFYFWGEILLADFNDIDRYLVNAKDLFTNISDIKEIESIFDYLTEDQKKALEQFWGSMAVADKVGFREKYISIWDKLFPVYSDFKKLLIQKQLAYPGMIDRDVAERVGKEELDFPFRHYYIIGLNALNNCESLIFKQLQKSGKAAFLWDYDKSYWQDEQNEAGYFMRRNLQQFPAPDDFGLNTEQFNNRKNIKLVAVSSVNGQSQQIPRFLQEIQHNYKKEFDNTAVVLADESLLFAALGAIPENTGTINITMGYPVRNSVVYGFMMLLVNLIRNRRKDNKNGYSVFYRYVTDILNHQLLGNSEKEKTRLFIASLKEKNQIAVPLAMIDFSPLHRQIFSIPEMTEDFSQYFQQVLGMFYHLQKESGDAMLLELIYTIHVAIGRLGEVVKKTQETQERQISEAVYFRLFSQYIGQVSVAFEGEPLSGLQVMGILETRSLDFENLIILGLNENKWPRKFTAPSFIPHNIRLGFGLPGLDEQDAMYGYYFYRLIQRAKNITATYSVVKEGIGTGELSRYGYQLLYDSVHKPQLSNLDFEFSNDAVESIVVESSAEIVNQLLGQNTAEHPLSPSAINTYLNCPLKFHFHYVADLPEPEEMKEEIDGMIFGNIFHDTMEELYSNFVGKTVNASQLEALLKDRIRIENEIRRQIGKHYFKQSKPAAGSMELSGKTLLIYDNILTYLKQLLKRDIAYAPFKLVSLEEKYKREMQVNGQAIWVGGKIDRVDAKAGTLRVLDYKTGNVEAFSFDDTDELFVRDARKPKKEILQALIYSWMLADAFKNVPVHSAIYSLRELFKDNFNPDVLRNKEKVEINAINQDFEAALKELVGEIYSGRNTFYQTGYVEKCSYCPYSGICRKY